MHCNEANTLMISAYDHRRPFLLPSTGDHELAGAWAIVCACSRSLKELLSAAAMPHILTAKAALQDTTDMKNHTAEGGHTSCTAAGGCHDS